MVHKAHSWHIYKMRIFWNFFIINIDELILCSLTKRLFVYINIYVCVFEELASWSTFLLNQEIKDHKQRFSKKEKQQQQEESWNNKLMINMYTIRNIFDEKKMLFKWNVASICWYIQFQWFISMLFNNHISFYYYIFNRLM